MDIERVTRSTAARLACGGFRLMVWNLLALPPVDEFTVSIFLDPHGFFHRYEKHGSFCCKPGTIRILYFNYFLFCFWSDDRRRRRETIMLHSGVVLHDILMTWYMVFRFLPPSDRATERRSEILINLTLDHEVPETYCKSKSYSTEIPVVLVHSSRVGHSRSNKRS